MVYWRGLKDQLSFMCLLIWNIIMDEVLTVILPLSWTWSDPDLCVLTSVPMKTETLSVAGWGDRIRKHLSFSTGLLGHKCRHPPPEASEALSHYLPQCITRGSLSGAVHAFSICKTEFQTFWLPSPDVGQTVSKFLRPGNHHAVTKSPWCWRVKTEVKFQRFQAIKSACFALNYC